jgi:streptogramin lyase
MPRLALALTAVAVVLSGCSQVHSETPAPQVSSVNFIGEWGVHGQMPGQLDMPVGLAVDYTERVYIADRGTSLLQKFTLDGVPLQTFEDPAVANAASVAVDSGGGIYVADPRAGTMHVFFPEGDPLRLFHVKQQGRSFEGPFVFSTDAVGSIFVPDYDGGGIQVFSSKGQLIGSWKLLSLPGVAQAHPIAAVAGHDGFLYVADAASGSIVKYRPTGERVGFWNDPADDGKLLGLAVSETHVFVLRSASPRLTIWSLDGKRELSDDLGGRLGAASGGVAAPGALQNDAWIAAAPGDQFLVLDASAPRVLRFQVRPGQNR